MRLKTEYIILVTIIGLTCFIISQKSNIEGLTSSAHPSHSGNKSSSGHSKSSGGSACSIM